MAFNTMLPQQSGMAGFGTPVNTFGANGAGAQVDALQNRILSQIQAPGQFTPPNYGSFNPPSGAYQGGAWNPGMGSSPGGWGAMSSSAAGQVSPYLSAQLRSLQQQGTQNLMQNVMPGIRSGAAAVGGIGGGREGVAEGIAAGNAQAGIAAAQANAMNQAFDSAQNRALSAYGMDQQTGLGYLNSDRSYGLGMGNLGLGYTQAGNQYALGQGGLANQRYGMDQNYALGQGGLQNQRYGMDQNYSLGLGNLGLGYFNGSNNYSLGQAQNQTTRDLGFGNLGLGYFNGANNFTLGQQQNQNQANQIANNYNLGQGQLGLQGQGQMLDFYNTQGAQDIQRYLAGLQGFQVGSNSPWGPLQNYGNILSPYTGNGTTTQTSQQGGGIMGGLGGALGAWQIANLMGRP